jgi:hypothetical protein
VRSIATKVYDAAIRVYGRAAWFDRGRAIWLAGTGTRIVATPLS